MKKPKYLYHATYAPLIPLIKKEGLGGKSAKPNWSDSKKNVTYWAISPDIAFSYAESAEEVDEEWLDEIVVFQCKLDNFNLKELFIDGNVLDDDSTLEYHNIMPYSKLEVVEDF